MSMAITLERSATPNGTASENRESLAERVRRLVEADIDFIPNSSFLQTDIDPALANPEAKANAGIKPPQGLPGHLARMCDTELLSAEEERAIFRRMNFLKFAAHSIRSELNLESPCEGDVARAERCLDEAMGLRDRIVKSNMRLVMSIVKKYVTPQHSFDELLSDGIFSLMQAAEKFDYDRGFRFSTYAYRSIARNAYRKINDRQKENARFCAASEQGVLDPVDDRASSSVQDEAWSSLRDLLSSLIDRLDRRERFIVRSRYALGAHRKARTFQCLADKLGVSKERVRQLEQRAVAKLRNFAAEEQLDEIVGAAFV